VNPSDAYVVMTSNFVDTIKDVDERAVLVNQALKHLSPTGVDFVVFDPGVSANKREDQGRTLRIASEIVPDKVYAKLDDYGSAKNVSEQVGHSTSARYVLTLMMAEDY